VEYQSALHPAFLLPKEEKHLFQLDKFHFMNLQITHPPQIAQFPRFSNPKQVPILDSFSIKNYLHLAP
jgi:hypothetical protein